MNDYTTLKQSQKLVVLGFEGAFPQYVWVPYKGLPSGYWLVHLTAAEAEKRPGSHTASLLYDTSTGKLDERKAWYPAPTLLRALEWLEEKDYCTVFADGLSILSAQSNEIEPGMHEAPVWQVGPFDSPSDLLDAILDKVEEENNGR